MASIPIDKVFNQVLYAKNGRVNKLSNPGGTVIGVVQPGDIIGKIYSYVLSNGKVYWMLDNIFGSQTFFVEHNPNLLNLPNKQAILDDIAKQAEAQKLQDKGIIQYNIDKYLPWVIGGTIVFLALPSLIGNQYKLSGMQKKKKNNSILLIGAAVVGAYLLTKKKKLKAGTPVIEPIDEGFVNEFVSASTKPVVNPVVLEDSFGNQSVVSSNIPDENTMQTASLKYGGGNGGYIDYVGPFRAVYEQPQPNIVAGRKKGNLGSIKTC